MAKFDFKRVLTFLKEYILMAVGMSIYSFGWVGCIIPAKGVGGGATGLSLILCTAIKHIFGADVPIGTMVLVINAVLLVIAGFIVGWKFGIKTIYCIFVLSVAMNIMQTLTPADGYLHLEQTLTIILGGILAGIGVAICFGQGGSTGGTDIVAMIINKYRTISYGKIVLYSDFVIIGSSMIVGYSIETVIYGYVMTAVFSYTVDMIMSGSHQSNQLLIATANPELMAESISRRALRGVTLLDSQGGYSKTRSQLVMVVCRKRETAQILKIVREVDPNAFMTVGSVMGVYGQGFETLNKL